MRKPRAVKPKPIEADQFLELDDVQEHDEEIQEDFFDKVFDALESILETKEPIELDDDFLKGGMYQIAFGCSLHADCILLVNESNKIAKILGPRAQLDFLFHSIRKRKRQRKKWPKRLAMETEKLISKIYNVNNYKAKEIIDALGPDNIANIIEKYNKRFGGVS